MHVFDVLLRRQKLLIHQETTKRPQNIVATFLMELNNLGFMVDNTTLAAIHFLRDETYKEILDNIKEMVGQRDYKAFYPNFPKQVMEASDAELYLNAVLHYMSFMIADLSGDADFIWLPKYDKQKREPLDEKVQLKKLTLASDEDGLKLLDNLINSNSSISETDKTDLITLFNHYQNYQIPQKIPQKEIAAVVGAELLKNNKKIEFNISSTNDVLRIASAYCNGDVSLAENTKFTKIPRFVRKELLNKINDKASVEDMLLHKSKWLRLGEALHPGEYKNRFPKVYECFRILRENEKITTFNSQVERLIKTKDIDVTKLLQTRPGYFARRLDEVLRGSDKKSKIIKDFEKVAMEVSTPVLLQVTKHFQTRNSNEFRVFMPKGNTAKLFMGEVKGEIDTKYTKKVEKVCLDTLKNKFSQLPHLGNCYIDPSLKNYLVPFSQRSASKALHTIVRGSQIPLENKNTIRFFIWWKQPNGVRVDLDLSSVLLDSKFKLVESIAYYNLRNENLEACHSGDVTSAPDGACEFIDLNIDSYAKRGRYVLMCVNAFTNNKFCDLPECFAGWMMREKPRSGEIFEAKTVKNKIDVTTGSRMVNPLIIDLEERKVIWADMSLTTGKVINNVGSNMDKLQIMGKALSNMVNTKWTVYDLIKLHVESRGKLVSKDKAQTVFGEELAYQPETIAAQFLI